MGFVAVVPEDDVKKTCKLMGPGTKVIGSITESGLLAGNLKLD
jgi:hypothetical protein